MLPDVFNNVFLLDFAFETTQCIFNGLTFMNPNLRHSVPPMSIHYQNGSRLFVLLSDAVRTMLAVPILSDSFLDCLPRGGRKLPRRILMRTAAISRLLRSENGKRTVCLDVAIVRVLSVSADQSSMTALVQDLRKTLRSQGDSGQQVPTKTSLHRTGP